jgi:hypothetical protein
LEALARNGELTGFEVLDTEDRQLVSVDQNDLRQIAAYSLDEANQEHPPRVVTRDASLRIIKPSFEPRYKWDFSYLGVRIAAMVRDTVFLENVGRGSESFASGDLLDCELQIGEEWNPALNAYVQKGYEVVRVNRHIHGARQMRLEPPDDSSNE